MNKMKTVKITAISYLAISYIKPSDRLLFAT